jgi:hypothetical protein
MKYEIDYNNQQKRFYLFEYVGDEPVTYDCKSGYCWRDCVPCSYCEASIRIIPDQAKYDAWKEKYKNRKKNPCSAKNNEYFTNHRLQTRDFTDSYFEIINGEAVPYIQKKIEFEFKE